MNRKVIVVWESHSVNYRAVLQVHEGENFIVIEKLKLDAMNNQSWRRVSNDVLVSMLEEAIIHLIGINEEV